MNTIYNLLSYETPANNSFTIPIGEGLEITYYAVCIVMGLMLAAALTTLLMHRRNISTDVVLLCFIVCVPSAIVGARLYACLSENIPVDQWITGIRNGGLSIMGGILGGAISAVILCLIKRWNFFRIADCIAPNFPLAQAIGRWGNYFNQEVYGGIVENVSLQFFPVSVLIEGDGQWHYAFFFYESVANFIWFFLLFILAWNMVKKPNGLFVGMFFAFYGLVRGIMEPLRDASFQYGGGEGINSSLVAAYALIALGVAIILFVLIHNKIKEGKFIGSAKGDEYTVTDFIPSEKGELPLYSSINYATKLLNKNQPMPKNKA
ncbi:MAG: prolipoprotein diacylglyceryl transferase [Clostridia bacterium]|nr:prolipoprotein diacylglyceryl transferase [Clostridia bacterium]